MHRNTCIMEVRLTTPQVFNAARPLHIARLGGNAMTRADMEVRLATPTSTSPHHHVTHTGTKQPSVRIPMTIFVLCGYLASYTAECI
jgi:hypothetical protein